MSMKLKSIFADDEAVSPVIGVILMVAITVILAAVIGTFVLGLGDQVQSTAPQASFAFDYTNAGADDLEIVHDGGDTIPENNLNVTIAGATGTGTPSVTWALDDLGVTANSDVAAGTSIAVDDTNVNGGGGDLDLSGATVRVVWNSPDGSNSATLGTWEGPDA